MRNEQLDLGDDAYQHGAPKQLLMRLSNVLCASQFRKDLSTLPGEWYVHLVDLGGVGSVFVPNVLAEGVECSLGGRFPLRDCCLYVGLPMLVASLHNAAVTVVLYEAR